MDYPGWNCFVFTIREGVAGGIIVKELPMSILMNISVRESDGIRITVPLRNAEDCTWEIGIVGVW